MKEKFICYIMFVIITGTLCSCGDKGGKKFVNDGTKDFKINLVNKVTIHLDTSDIKDAVSKSPICMNTDDKGNIYVLDYKMRSVKKYPISQLRPQTI